MSSGHKGRCLCGDVGYVAGADPLWITVCYCRFCQRATGSDRMIEPIFAREAFAFCGKAPTVHTLPSEGSGLDINVHHCARCGTKLALTFERWPDLVGIYAGTLDEPAAIAITPANSKHIFVAEARPGTILPPGVRTFARHATTNDGTPNEPVVYSAPHVVGG